jgi:hypothetical protein
LTLDSSGNVLVGKTGTTFSDVGAVVRSTGSATITRDGGDPLALNRKTSDGEILGFYKDGSTVGSIGSYAGLISYMVFDPRTDGSGLTGSTNQILPTTQTGGLSDAAKDLGSSSYRFKDAYLSGGVYLGGTGSANKLDDYEEGTWTPTWSSLFTQGTFNDGTGFSTAAGRYIKIGQLVWCYAEVVVSGTSSDITLQANYSINNSSLPFTVADDSNNFRILHGTGMAYNSVGSGVIGTAAITPLDSQNVLVVTYTGVSATGLVGSSPQSLGFCYRTTA